MFPEIYKKHPTETHLWGILSFKEIPKFKACTGVGFFFIFYWGVCVCGHKKETKRIKSRQLMVTIRMLHF